MPTNHVDFSIYNPETQRFVVTKVFEKQINFETTIKSSDSGDIFAWKTIKLNLIWQNIGLFSGKF